jgi:hypothetical protein
MIRPPSGQAPPEQARGPDGERVALRPLAEEACRRYGSEYPDERERYGDAGMAWCVHDLQHVLNWALADAAGLIDLDEQLRWLAGVLEARDFPLDRLARGLELAATVVEERLGEPAAGVAGRLSQAAAGLAPG